MFNHSLLTKYNIIFDIVHNLDSRFALLKECVLKEVSKIYFNPASILDIPDLQTYLIGKLDTKSMSTQYRTDMVTLSKKIPVHAASVKTGSEKLDWSPEKTAEFDQEFNKIKLSMVKENEIRDDMLTLARKLSEDANLESTVVFEHPQIREVLKKHNARVCYNCMSPNCFIKRQLGNKMNLKEKLTKGCRCPIKMKFSRVGVLKLSSELSHTRLPKKKTTAANMQAKFSTPLHSKNKIHETMEVFNSYNDKDVSHGFRTSPTHAMRVIAKVPITEAILPNVEMLERTANIADKYCIICLKQKMTNAALALHLLDYHDGLMIKSPLSAWLEAEEQYVSDEDYDSDNEIRFVDSDLEESDNIFSDTVSPHKNSISNRYSSSEDSTSSISSSKRKRRQKRILPMLSNMKVKSLNCL